MQRVCLFLNCNVKSCFFIDKSIIHENDMIWNAYMDQERHKICILYYHPSLPLYLPADSISKTRIKVRVSWAGLINSEQELSPNSPNI
jgi:hypothetical protein